MKNKIKEIIKNNYKFAFMFILGIIVAGGGVYAATNISGGAITYDNSSSGLLSTNVQDAVDELSGKADTNSIKTLPNIIAAYKYSTATATKCTTGEESTCVATYCYADSTSGSCEPGTIIKYKVNDTEIKNFNVISDDGDTIDMQSIDATATGYWNSYNNIYGPDNLITLLDDATENWTNVNDQSYTMGHYGTASSCTAYNACYSNSYELERTAVKARFITVQEAAALGCTNSYGSCPSWMNAGNSTRIWTMSTADDSTTNHVWLIFAHYQYLSPDVEITEDGAVKAIVNINKPV